MTSFTIVVATKNAEDCLGPTLVSIKRSIEALPYHHQVLIQDGLSTDNTFKVAEKYGKTGLNISFQSERDKSIYDAWNKAIARATCEWISFVGAGDICISPAYSAMLHQFIADNNINCFSGRSIIKYPSRKLKTTGQIFDKYLMRRNFCVAHSSFFYRKSLFATHGMFSLDYNYCSDYDYLLRIGDHLAPGFYPAPVVIYPFGGISSRSLKPVLETYNIRKSHFRNFLFRDIIELIKGSLQTLYLTRLRKY